MQQRRRFPNIHPCTFRFIYDPCILSSKIPNGNCDLVQSKMISASSSLGRFAVEARKEWIARLKRIRNFA